MAARLPDLSEQTTKQGALAGAYPSDYTDQLTCMSVA